MVVIWEVVWLLLLVMVKAWQKIGLLVGKRATLIYFPCDLEGFTVGAQSSIDGDGVGSLVGVQSTVDGDGVGCAEK